MKKILGILTLLVFLPFSAFALEMMHDDAMDEVTAQAGISIVLETDFALDLEIGSIGWNDADAIACYPGAGTVSACAAYARTGATLPIGLEAYNAAGSDGIDIIMSVGGAISIDVGQDTTGSYMSGQPFLSVGLHNLNVNITSIDTSFMGPINIAGLCLNINNDTNCGGALDIGAILGTAGSTGMNIGIGMTISACGTCTPLIQALSWGDLDGIFQNGTTDNDNNPGYIGITNLYVMSMPISGAVTIEAGTDTGRTLGHGVATTTGIEDDTFLRIGLSGKMGTGMMTIGDSSTYISMAIELGNDNTLGDGQMGILSINNLSIGVSGHIQISAH